MAIDIMDALVQFLCPTSQSAMMCNQFINTPHHQVLAPIGPLLYFFLFPTIFLIIFIYILSTSVLKGPAGAIKGIKLLIALGVYIFIIINGWYSIMLPLAELWFILLPFLGILYFIVRHFSGGGGPAGGMAAGGGRGLLGQIIERGKKEFTGERKRLEDMVDLSLKEIGSVVEQLKKDPQAWRAYSSQIAHAHDILAEYSRMLEIGGFRVGGGFAKKLEKLERLLDEVAKAQKKAA